MSTNKGFAFNEISDFFPTPRTVGRKMYAKITNKNAKYFLDPSAGKGDLADVIRRPMTYEEFQTEVLEGMSKEDRADWRRHGSYYRDEDRKDITVDTVEAEPSLIHVLRGKEYDVVGFDWLSYGGLAYYDAVLMNPPFSNGAAHLLKAWDFMYRGEIVCLLNEETIRNPYTAERQRLVELIQKAGGTVEDLGDCFSTAERKTDVRVVMVYLKKEAPADENDLWADEAKRTQEKDHGVDLSEADPNMPAIRDLLGNMEHWFNMATEHWLEGIKHIRKAVLYMSQNKVESPYGDRQHKFDDILKLAMSNVHECRAEFMRTHRRQAWKSVIEQMEFHKLLDSKQQDRFLRDIERDSTIPFTAENIKETLRNIMSQRKRLFEESVANVFDELCSHAIENGSGPEIPARLRENWRRGEGWKTNDTYKVNERLVFPYGCEVNYGGRIGVRYGSNARTVYHDLDRILCVLDGQKFENCYTIGKAIESGPRPGSLIESEYFEIRCYKKGTVHLKWKRKDLLERFNVTAAKGKKWLGGDTSFKKAAWRTNPDYYCKHNGHEFANGVCKRCEQPEVDPLDAVECPLCRAVAEYTGETYCPLHPLPELAPTTEALKLNAA